MSEIELLDQLRRAIINGEIDKSEQLSIQTIKDGIDPIRTFEEGLREGISVVGEGFACGEYFLPDLVISAEALKKAAKVLEDELSRKGLVRMRIGKVVLGTVEGDLHDIGKTIVGTLLSAHGFEVIDLGVNVPVNKFIAAIDEHSPQIVGLSSLLTITAKELKKVIDAIGQAGLRDSVKVIIGGGAVTQEYANAIGADGFARNAELGVRVANELLAAK